MTSEEKEAPALTNTREPELFTASDVARFCQVDLKTIHNWADKGEIRHFRTPGRHLRFRRLDVLDFLRKYGYPIPEVLRMGKPKVVVIDDDPAVLAALRKTLARKFDLTTFQDPFDALVAVGSLQPDALILDVKMPGLDGISAAREVSAERLCAVVLLTAFSQRKLIESARDAGVMAYLVKPFQREDLVPAIELAVGRFVELVALADHSSSLEDQLATRKLSDRAKALLISAHGMTEEEAFRFLQRGAMNRRVPMRQVATEVLNGEFAP